MDNLGFNAHPAHWETKELFDYLVDESILHPDARFEDWINNRVCMLQLVIDNNQ